jgi:hypothetical protein
MARSGAVAGLPKRSQRLRHQFPTRSLASPTASRTTSVGTLGIVTTPSQLMGPVVRNIRNATRAIANGKSAAVPTRSLRSHVSSCLSVTVGSTPR